MADFPSTQWSLIRRSGESPSQRRAAFGELAIAYRAAIFAFFRARLGADAAEDATQSFLAASFEHAWWARADAGIGSFRGFLLMLMRRHLGHLRGGHRPDHVALDAIAEVPDDQGTAEQLFDARFALVLTGRAVDSLRDSYAARGRAVLFDGVLPLLSSPPAHGELKRIAEDLGMPANTLTVEISRLRARLRDRVHQELRELCADEAGYRSDCAALKESMGGRG